MRRPVPDPPAPGQESVWDYPRPPRIESVPRRIRVEVAGSVIADAPSAIRILETSHPPTYYIDPASIRAGVLHEVPGGSFCEWKGVATYFDVVTDAGRIERAAWTYREPSGDFAALADHVAFYPALVECFVDDEAVRPQPGRFYGGWVTADLAGPFKGEPGTEFW